jgi:hypothetical protein
MSMEKRMEVRLETRQEKNGDSGHGMTDLGSVF